MSEELERDILQRVGAELQAEGYELFIHPARSMLPGFFNSYVPDAVARRGSSSIAIEVTRKSPQRERRISELTRLFEKQPEWSFRVIWIEPASSSKDLEVQSPIVIAERIEEVRKLLSRGHSSSALLLGWATFEALGRILMPEQFHRPQTPGRLVQILASNGYLTPTEADKLRELASKRNAFIHGELQTQITTQDADEFWRILETLMGLAGS